MTVSDCSSKIRLVIQQIEKDSGVNATLFEEHREKAVALLEEIVNGGQLPAQGVGLMPQLKKSIDDFYNPTYTRGLAQRLVLQDLSTLERLCLSKETCSRRVFEVSR
jgi:hypothetical protein